MQFFFAKIAYFCEFSKFLVSYCDIPTRLCFDLDQTFSFSVRLKSSVFNLVYSKTIKYVEFSYTHPSTSFCLGHTSLTRTYTFLFVFLFFKLTKHKKRSHVKAQLRELSELIGELSNSPIPSTV